MARLLLLAAHPDDAEITMAGTLARYATTGWDVTVAIFTSSSPRIREAATAAAEIIGHRLVWVEQGARAWVEDFREIELVSIADELVQQYRPDVLVSHWREDSHRDHARLAAAALASVRRTSASLYALPPSEFRSPAFDAFTPNTHVDISDYMHIKESALAEFQYEGWAWQQVDTAALLALAHATGARMGWRGAESFRLLRQIGLSGPDFGTPSVTTLGSEEQSHHG